MYGRRICSDPDRIAARAEEHRAVERSETTNAPTESSLTRRIFIIGRGKAPGIDPQGSPFFEPERKGHEKRKGPVG